MTKIQENITKIKSTLPETVKLCAVSKFHSAENVIDAIKGGQTLFGENRVQEASAKFDEIRNAGYKADLHIIGTLQRNKVKEAVRISSCIESVDRLELLEEIEKQAAKISKTIEIFFEIHTGEESKSGFEINEDFYKAVSLCSQNAFPHVKVSGLMTMAPNTDDTELVRNSFRKLKNLQTELKEKFSMLNFEELSMGMSGDYPIAIEEGSTIVRIGTAIFGQRS